MPFQWLDMRITEEQDRRRKEAEIQKRLPRALDELREMVEECLKVYNGHFGSDSAELQVLGSGIRVVVQEENGGRWQQVAQVEVSPVLALPGFQVDSGGKSFQIEVGLLPNDKVFYRDRDQDQFLTMEELMRRVLDRALFPKLGA